MHPHMHALRQGGPHVGIGLHVLSSTERFRGRTVLSSRLMDTRVVLPCVRLAGSGNGSIGVGAIPSRNLFFGAPVMLRAHAGAW